MSTAVTSQISLLTHRLFGQQSSSGPWRCSDWQWYWGAEHRCSALQGWKEGLGVGTTWPCWRMLSHLLWERLWVWCWWECRCVGQHGFEKFFSIFAVQILFSVMRRSNAFSWPPHLAPVSASGIHYIGNLEQNRTFRCLVDQLTNGQVQWEPMENPYDQVVLGLPENRRIYPIYSGRQRFPQELKKCFPGEEKAIDEFMRLVKVSFTLLKYSRDVKRPDVKYVCTWS